MPLAYRPLNVFHFWYGPGVQVTLLLVNCAIMGYNTDIYRWAYMRDFQ